MLLNVIGSFLMFKVAWLAYTIFSVLKTILDKTELDYLVQEDEFSDKIRNRKEELSPFVSKKTIIIISLIFGIVMEVTTIYSILYLFLK